MDKELNEAYDNAITEATPLKARTVEEAAEELHTLKLRAVAKAVDDEIYTQISTNAGNTVAAGGTWDSVTESERDPVQDILNAQAEISIDNYDPYSNTFLLLNPNDYKNLLGNSNVRNAGQFYTDSVTRNGVVGQILGLTIISSNSILEGGAQIVIAKEAMTWKSVQGLTVNTIDDPGINQTIKAFQGRFPEVQQEARSDGSEC